MCSGKSGLIVYVLGLVFVIVTMNTGKLDLGVESLPNYDR